MNTERWLRVDRLYRAALEREESQRGAFLDQACGGDDALRREVESRLANQKQAAGSGAPGPLDKAKNPESNPSPHPGNGNHSLVGKTIAQYRISEKIGVGGMGEVYLAHDERLDRDVAVKVLPHDVLADESVRKRLRKEAVALSKLNHPNIETLLDFVEADGRELLVVEYIAGVTLSDLISKGPLPEKEIARLGVQLADGLKAAHEQRIVHRDLKPGNLRITADGRLKILDFGIAKLFRPSHEGARTDTTTESDSTGSGQAPIGTLPYMSPEQLQSQRADARTDIHAAGAVLYEMATGQRAFHDETSPLLIDAILHQEPVTPRALNARLSPEMERIILKCLKKEPDDRYQSAQELEVDLRQLALPKTAGVLPHSRPKYGRWRNVALAAAVVLIVAATLIGLNVGGLRDLLQGVGSGGRIESLAVLPLANLSGDPQQDYFADGMTDLLITDLSQISAFHRVISRTSIMQYKGTQKSLAQIARELRVDAVIEGSVLLLNNRVRISATLREATTDRDIWSRTYERDVRDVLKLQGDVASAIANGIQVAVTPQERHRLTSAPPVIPAAYEAYLKGRYHWSKDTERDWLKAREDFEQAVKIDPHYAAAYAGLADYYCFTDELPPRVKMPTARQYALKALEIDSDLAEAHTSLGAIRFFADWNWPEAEKEFKRALERDPGNLEARRLYSDFLSEMGRADEALAEVRSTQEFDPVSVSTQVMVGWTLYFARRYDEAVEQCRKVVDLEPNSVNAHDCLGLSYLAKNLYQKAIEECQKSVNLSDNDLNKAVDLARAQALAGNKAEARKALNEWRVRAERTYVPPTFFARVHFALGEKDEGFAWLEAAFTQRDEYLTLLVVDPAFDSVRSDSRFHDLLRRLGSAP